MKEMIFPYIQRYLQKAENKARSGKVVQVLVTLKEACERFPTSWQVWLMAGQILLEIGYPARAISPLKRAKEINSDEFQIHFVLCSVLGRTFALKDGIAELEVAETMRLDDDEVLHNLGWMRCILIQIMNQNLSRWVR
ncbi:MAG: tetratricopeptide repeat protein [Candidatus Zixiibacteriota bacterium]